MARSHLHRRLAAVMKDLSTVRGEQALAKLTPEEIKALVERLQARYEELTGTTLTPVVTVRYVNDWRNAHHGIDEDDEEAAGM
jgi:hypothetical protein